MCIVTTSTNNDNDLSEDKTKSMTTDEESRMMFSIDMDNNNNSHTKKSCNHDNMVKIIDEFLKQCQTSVPSMCSAILIKVPWIISLIFVGSFGSHELAAAALATTLCNVTGMSLCVGLNSALSTLTGQSRGDLLSKRKQQQQQQKEKQITEKQQQQQKGEQKENIENNDLSSSLKSSNYNNNHVISYNTFSDEEEQKLLLQQDDDDEMQPLLPLVYLYRGIFIQLLFVLPVGIWWLIGIKPILLYFKQDEILSSMTQEYLRILTPGLWSHAINYTFTSWLFAIGMPNVPACVSAVGITLHIPMNMIFTNLLGYKGVALATTTFQFIQPILVIIYLCYTNHGSNRVYDNTIADVVGIQSSKQLTIRWNVDVKMAICSISGIYEYLSLAIPGIVIISEWWASETIIFLSGTLQPNPAFALAGMTIYQSINSTCFMIPVGISIAVSTRVSNLLGEGNDINRVDLSAKVAVCSATILSTILGCILYFTPHTTFPSIFTSDINIINETSKLIPLLSLYVFADGVQVCLNGIIKGCGRQAHILPIVITAYWLVGVPLAYYLTFVRNHGIMCDNNENNDNNNTENDDYFCGDVGLVAAMTTGTFLHLILLGILVVFTTNWKEESRKAKARIALKR